MWSSSKNMILVQTLNLTGCHGNRKDKIAKKIFKKVNFSEAVWGIKLNLERNNISLNKNVVFIDVA